MSLRCIGLNSKRTTHTVILFILKELNAFRKCWRKIHSMSLIIETE